MFLGMEDRLHRELTEFVEPNVKVKVTAPTNRKYSVFIGGTLT